MSTPVLLNRALLPPKAKYIDPQYVPGLVVDGVPTVLPPNLIVIDGSGPFNMGDNGIAAILPPSVEAVAITLPAPDLDWDFYLEFWDFVGAAHTITTPDAAINTLHSIITFDGTAFTVVRLRACYGTWLVQPAVGYTISGDGIADAIIGAMRAAGKYVNSVLGLTHKINVSGGGVVG